jgi:glycosyltransferase involved in cell wall biosynthesis
VSGDSLRVALIAPCWFTVPPTGYGGIERIVALLADGLVAQGHDVTLFASGGSHTAATLVSPHARPPSKRIGQSNPALEHALACLVRAGEFDVINDHSGALAAALLALGRPTPACHTVHGPLTGEDGRIYRGIAATNPAVRLISLSHSQRTPAPELPWLANCPNALDLDRYRPGTGKDDYVLFLGRMASEKGPARAIRAARSLGIEIRLAGKLEDPAEIDHFEREVQPLLGDGAAYLGEVSIDEKVELLQRARATLFPITWPEPFGLVMIESMACGTPVVATRFGAVPEVLEDGIGSVIVDDVDQLAAGLERALTLSGEEARAVAEGRFSAERMVTDYANAYAELVAAADRPTAFAEREVRL